MKKFVWFLTLILALSLVLSACGTPPATCLRPKPRRNRSPATEAPAATEAPVGRSFRVAVVMPSAINDLAFSQSMYDALAPCSGRDGR